MIVRSKVNYILVKIELSYYKQQKSYPMYEHFQGPIK